MSNYPAEKVTLNMTGDHGRPVGTATYAAADPAAIESYRRSGSVLRYWRVHKTAQGFRSEELDPAGWIDLVKASTCETCRDGCTCSGPGTGCGHFACWGHEADGSCPEAQRIRS